VTVDENQRLLPTAAEKNEATEGVERKERKGSELSVRVRASNRLAPGIACQNIIIAP
jgi:hypothetical protein